jgi:hypothetical protein
LFMSLRVELINLKRSTWSLLKQHACKISMIVGVGKDLKIKTILNLLKHKYIDIILHARYITHQMHSPKHTHTHKEA